MPPKHILFLSSWFPDRIAPANGDFVKRHALAAAKVNQVTVLFVRYDPAMTAGVEHVETREGNYTEIIRYFGLSKGLFKNLRKTYLYLKYYMEGFRSIRHKFGDSDLVHANITFPIGLLALLFKWRFGKPYLISEHWSAYLAENQHKLSRWRKWIDRRVAAGSAGMIPVTANMRDSLIRLGFKTHFWVVPNVIDIGGFYPAAEPANTKTFVHLSTLNNPIKNISGMIDAAALLYLKRQDFRLEIIGLESVEEHRQYAIQQGIYRKCVEVHEAIAYSEVPEKLRNSMCLLMFSNYESLPCVIIEALASGIPVISSKVGGISEYLGEKQGILVKKGDVEALTEAMNHMLDNNHRYPSQELHDYAVQHFSDEAIGPQLDAIYYSVLSHA